MSLGYSGRDIYLLIFSVVYSTSGHALLMQPGGWRSINLGETAYPHVFPLINILALGRLFVRAWQTPVF